MAMAETIKLLLFRYDPAIDPQPTYQPFQVPWKPHMTILDALIYVYENLDSSLAFVYGCRYGVCGTCAMKVNGKPMLVCKELARPEMKIEPLDNFPIVRDLVIDREGFNRKTKRVRPFIERGPAKIAQPEALSPGDFEGFRHVYQCVECLACDSICPSMTEDPFHFSGPALFAQMGRQAMDPRDQLDRTPMAVSEGLFHCLRCGSCREVCPYGVDIPKVIIGKIRRKALDQGMSPPEIRGMIQEMRKAGKPFSTQRPPKSVLMAHKPEFPGLADAEGEVGVFLGCNIEYQPWLLETGRSAIRLFKNRLPLNATLPGNVPCCGLPLIEAGSKEGLEEIVCRNVGFFEAAGVKEVVALCPGCALTMKNEWPGIFESAEGRKPRFQAFDSIEFLTRQMEGQRGRLKSLSLKVTYHEPCHSSRYLGLSTKARDLIRLIPGVKLMEMEESDRCCGGGGEVLVVNPNLAFSLAEKKADRITRLGVDAVVTSCPTCIMQLSRALGRRKARGIRVLHLVSLLDMALV